MKYKRILFFAACLIGLNANSQSNLVWSNVDTVIKDLAFGNTRPKIALTRNNVPVVMWGRGLNKEVFVARHNGSGFNAPVKVSPSGMNTYVQNWVGPDMVAQGDTVYVTFKSLPESQGYVYVVKSTDGGETFGDTVRVSNNIWSRFPSLGIRPDGNPIVTYMEFDSNFHDPRYVVSTSMDWGVSFTSPVDGTYLANGEVCDCCPGFVMGSENETHLLFRNNDQNLRDIWASKSVDGGLSFPIQEDIDPNGWIINSCPSTGPDAFLTQDSVISAWMSAASGNTTINVGVRNRSALADGYSVELLKESSEIHNYPKVAGKESVVGVAWQGNTMGNTDILFVWSKTGVSGLKSSSIDTVNVEVNKIQMNPDIEHSDGLFHFVWQDMGDKSVKYRSVNISEVSGVYEGSNEASVTVFPVPARDKITIMFSSDIRPVQVDVFNKVGQRVLKSQYPLNESMILELGSLSTGLYTLMFRMEDHTLMNKKIVIIR
jgi:hypothetical protein